jgi:hypothetical protein
MTFTDVLEKVAIPLIAAAIGAVLAFRYQHTLELKRDKRQIIQALMMYRNVGANELDFIKALNAVDIIFHDNKKVRTLLHTYFDQVTEPYFHNYQWRDTFFEMLYEMAQSSGYSNLTKDDIRNYYYPRALDWHYPNTNVQRPPSDDTLTADTPTKVVSKDKD